MIEINLLPGKKKKAAPGAGFKLALPDFQGLIASIKNPWLLVASLASVIVVGGGLLLFITQSTRLRVLNGRLADVQAEKRRFDAVTGGANVAPGSAGATSAPTATDSAGAPQVRVWITGSTVDIQAYTTFLRQLAASPWLTDVTPATTSTVIEADRPVTAFNVAVRFRVADSVYMRTVPMTQSAR